MLVIFISVAHGPIGLLRNKIILSYLILYIQGHSLVFVHNKTKETPSNVVEIMRRAIDYLTNKAITDHILQNKTDLSHKIFNEAISSKTH